MATFTRKDERLLCHYTSQDDFELYPESATKFFNNSHDIQITFTKDTHGVVTELAFTQEGAKSNFLREK